MEFLFQARQTCVLSCVSSEWNLATNSGSYRFQISYFNIANHSGTHMQKAQGKNIWLCCCPSWVCWRARRMGLTTASQGDPWRLCDWHWVCFPYLPPSAFLGTLSLILRPTPQLPMCLASLEPLSFSWTFAFRGYSRHFGRRLWHSQKCLSMVNIAQWNQHVLRYFYRSWWFTSLLTLGILHVMIENQILCIKYL